jgi:ActR/RegA family two-component response regulator/tetratricopeptide (TPR) repeat protein
MGTTIARPIVKDEVLLVEDDPDVGRLLTQALADQGFDVHHVPTSESALAVLASRDVACVVLGVQPDDAAIELLGRLRTGHPSIPVVVTAADVSVDFAIRAVKGGAADVVETTGDVARIAAKVRAAVADSGAGSSGRRRRLLRTAFVGRETELRHLEAELERASGGQGRVVLITGDAGIGKTSLAFELGRRARARGTLVLWGHCDDSRAAPAYWPWTKILRGYVGGIDPDVVREDLDAAGPALASLVPSLRDTSRDPDGAHPAECTRFQLFDAVIQFLRHAAARRPLVCVLDDLHEADGDSVQLLRSLTTEIADARLLVVAAYRDAVVDPATRAEIGRIADHPAAGVVHLSGFDETDVWRYIVETTDVRPPKALVRAIVGKTEGNPLFVADVVNLLAADERLDEDPVAGELQLAIPESRRQAVAHRLGRLSDACRRTLETAAVVGPEVEIQVLSLVLDQDAASVRAAIDEAIAHRLVVVGELAGAIRFTNVLVRDVLHDHVPAADRARIHGRIADVLETTSAARAERPLAAIAHHRLASATCTADVARAYGYVVAAAQRAAELMAHEEAARCYELALRVAERAELATPIVQTELLVELAETHWRAGHTEAARAVGRRALAVAKESGEAAVGATAALAFAGRLPGFGAIACDEEVVAELERALTALPPTASALRAMLMARLAEELTYLPRRTADRTLAPKAITLARSLDEPAVLASVLRTTQWSVWTPDDVERRRQLAEEIVALAGRTHDPMLALDGELFRLWSALEHGEMDVARRQLVLASRLAERLRLPYYSWITTMARACLHIATGRFDDAERIADEALRAADATANPTVPLFVGAQRGHIMWHRGRFEELARWLTDVVGGFSMLAATLDCSLVITYAEAGQRELARAELGRFAADDFVGVPRNPMWLMNMTSLAVGCVAVGDVEAAGRLYPLLAPFARYNIVVVPVWVGAPVAHYMGGLAALLGDVVAARRHYEDALVLEARTGTRQWGARTQLAYARLLRASGRPGDAARADELVASSRAIALELGLAPVLAQVDAMEPATARDAASVRRCRFHRHGDAWELDYAGKRATVRHRVGMEYLRQLLARPGEPVPVLELASGRGSAVLVERAGGPAIDRRAFAEVQRRIAEIELEVEGYAARGATASEALRAELAECRGYLAKSGGGVLSASDRARPSVTKAIDRAIAAITDAHPVLGHHLRRHVETGRTCVYVPDVGAPVRFEL